MYRKLHFVWIILLTTISCGGPKELSEFEMLPAWAKTRPMFSDAYVGIGSAKKVGTSNVYIAKAREKALADLAAEISVNVDATSVLHTVSSQLKVSETLYTKNKLSATEHLEGYEPVDYFDGPENYWVFYKIGKEVYTNNKNERKQKAINQALEHYKSALAAEKQHKPIESLSGYLKGIEALKNYLNENTQTTFNGKEIALGQELFNKISGVNNEFKIIAIEENVNVKRGKALENPVLFKVTFNDVPVSNVGVNVTFTGGFLAKSHLTTNADGICKIKTDKIKSQNQREYLEAKIDQLSITRKATKDIFIRGFMDKIKFNTAQTTINITSPVVSIHIKDGNGIRPLKHESIIEQFEKAGQQFGYKLVKHPAVGDLKLNVRYHFKNKPVIAQMHTSLINLDIRLTGENNQEISMVLEEYIKGKGSTDAEAQNNAWKEMLHLINTRLKYQVFEPYFK